MRNGGCKVDMAHALSADDGARDFDAAFLADDTAEADAAVFAAVAFVVFFRAENALVEEAVLFRSLRAVVDGLGFCDFAVRPIQHSLWTREPHRYRFEVLRNYILSFLHIRDS